MSTIYSLVNDFSVESSFSLSSDLLSTLEQSLYLAQEQLREFAKNSLFRQQVSVAFGDGANLETFQADWSAGDFSQTPKLEILDRSILGNANGAYASSTNKIYLSSDFIATATPTALSAVLLEEIGHFVDTRVNQTDSAGDEGAIFASLVQGEILDTKTLQALKAEDDRAIITINGEAISIEQATNILKTTTGDGSLEVTIDEFGRFGSSSVGGRNAFYDPIGSKTASSTTYLSFVALGIINTNGTTGSRTELQPSASNNELFTSVSNNATSSTFSIGGLQFQLNQAVQDTLNNTQFRNGSRLDQTYTIINTTNQTINFDLVRYVDGDLAFDGSNSDGGGRISQNGQEILFETDRGGTGQTDTTFFGITGIGGTLPTTNRWELDSYSSLRSNVGGGNTLRNSIVFGDSDSNQFIDSGSEYDVALALRNVFSLAPRQSTNYTTTTRFGSGGADQLDITSPTGGVGNLSATTVGSNVTVTWGATDLSGIKNYDVFVSINGAGFTQWQTSTTATSAIYTGEIGKTYTFYSLATDNAGNKQIASNAPRVSTLLVNPVPGTLSFSSPQFSLREDGKAIAAVTITRTVGSDGAVSATINFKDGTAKSSSDYSNVPITVNFANDETSKTVNIPIVNDAIAEPDEALQLSLTNATGGASIGQQNSAALTILDNDGLSIVSFPQGSSGSNKGQTTIAIAGQKFLPTDIVSLVALNGTVRAASRTYWVSDTETWATFDLQGLNTGTYDVKIANGTSATTSNAAFTVTNGSLGSIQTTLSYPTLGVATVSYTNIGQTDLVAPLFRISATNAQVNSLVQPSSSATLNQLLNLNLGGGDKSAAGILAPGERGQFSFAYTPNGNGLISFAVEQVPANEVINWAAIKAESRTNYSFIDAAGWDALWSNLTANLGTTVGQFQAVMAENANYLSQLGQPTSDLNRLFAFEWKQAANTLTNVDLLSTTDIVDAAPGLSLSFNRTFHQSLAERYNLGTLGRGWDNQWDVRATTDSQGNVIIRSVGDLQRVFEKQTNGTYLGENGVTLTLINGEYRLKEANGIVSLFGSNGKLSYVEDTNGNRITLQYANNLLSKLVHTNGDSLTFAYNAQGRISQITDSTGQASSYSYDASGENLLSVTTPQGTTTYSYDTGNLAAKKYSLLSVISDQGYQRSFAYDNQGRLIQESSNGQTQTLNYSYDSTGGVTITDSTGASQTVLLDDRGNAGQIRGVNNQNLLFGYDTDGNLKGATLPSGGKTAYSYDTLGNLTQQKNLANQNVKFTYDSTFNQLTGFTDPKGNGVSYGYDPKGNLNKITYADGSTQQFGVDAAGNVTSSVSRSGSTILYTYNNNGLLTKKQYADGSSVAYGYDSKGNVTSVTDATGLMTLQYDVANQLTKISYPNGRSLTYTYNADGQRTKLVSQDGYTVNYSYDVVGRLKSLTDGTGQSIISYDYDSAGRLTKETNGNGTYTTYQYDQQSQLTQLINYKANNTVNSKFEYAYDNLGRRTSMTTLEGTFQYGYDATGQLTSVVTPTNRTINYQYDAAGNRIGVTDNGTTTNYNTNNLNEYTNVGNAVYAYDANGNLTSKTEAGQTSSYTYNAENRLTKVVTPQGTWEYQYDGLGNRIATTVNGQRTEYLLDPTGLGDIVGEYDNNGNLVARYNQGIGLVSRVDGSGANYYDADAIGSTVGLTANDGSYVNRYSYLPFGEDLTKVEAVANPFEYVGQWGVMDEGNGLDFMRARFYDSGLGRFTAIDPIGLNGGDTTFYRYVGNSPVSYNDPSGKFTYSGFITDQISGYILGEVGEFIGGKVVGVAVGAIIGGLFGAGLGFLAGLGPGAVFGAELGAGIGARFGGRLGGLLGAAFGDILATPTELGDDSAFIPVSNPNPIPFTYSQGGFFQSGGGVFPSDPSFYYSPPPTTNSGTYNDPHLQTLDGLGYDFQTVGEFTLVKSTTDDFEIQTRQKPWGTSTSASANSAISVQIGGQRIAFYANQAQPLLINGTAVTLADGSLYAVGQNLISRSGSQYSIITANNDLILIQDRGTFLNINLGLADNRQGKVVGLLGNDNNIKNDDFALRNGTVIGGTISNQQLYGEYADSWRITQATSLFDYVSGQDTNTFTDRTFPRNIITAATLTPAQRAAAEQIARNAGITDPSVLEDVILDIFISNGDPLFIEGAVSQQRLGTLSASNTLINPDGFGTQHWLAANALIPYTIRFSNNAAQGTTPVAQVAISQQLDTDLDFNTFTLNSFSFGAIALNVPTGTQNYSQRLDLRTTKGVYVDVNAGLDKSTGIVTWTFTAINPVTGNPSTTQGFLPPNDSNGSGRGSVGYSIQSKANGTNGTRVDAQASITFDNQPPIQTSATFNTLDRNLPTSQVSALAANSSNPTFTVSWSGNDTESGIATYDIYVSTNGGNYVIWQKNTTNTSKTFTGKAGKTYAFYSIAKDRVGYVEAAPAQPDTTIVIASINLAPTNLSLSANSIRENLPTNTLIGNFTSTDPNPNNTFTYSLVTGTGDTNNSLFTINGNGLRAKTSFDYETKNSYSIRVRTADQGGLSFEKVLTVNVTNVNEIPTLTGTPAALTAGTEDIPYNISASLLLQGFTDVDGDTLSVSGLTASNGTLTNNGNGTYNFAPNANFNGNVSLTYKVTDGNGGIVPATQSFAIAAVNDAPITSNPITAQIATEDSPFNFAIPANTFSDVDASDTLTYSATLADGTSLPSWLTFNAATGAFSGNPTSGDVGTLSVKVTATDLANSKAENTFDIVITPQFNIINGTESSEILIGTSANDLIFGLGGDNVLLGLAGNNILVGGDGNNILVGGDENDILIGGTGNNILIGGTGNNIFIGGDSDDLLIGGDSDDLLIGRGGNDLLVGGTGNDFFAFSTNEVFNLSKIGQDIIADFDTAKDKIVLDKITFNSLFSIVGSGFSQSSEFAVVSTDAAAQSSGALITYNNTNGNLFYNQNGAANGLGSGGLFANLNTNPSLSANNFLLAV
jgi:RHS repeat-associated protein